MRIETLKDRIRNAEETITKKHGTITKKAALIEKKKTAYTKAQDENERYWLTCDVNQLEEDIMRLEREIKETENALEGYREKLAIETEKANSRNVPAIIEFLERWKVNVTEYYNRQFQKYLEEREERGKENQKYCNFVNGCVDRFAWQETRAEEREAERNFNKKWHFIFRYIDRKTFNSELLAKDLERDANAKYDDIIERTNAICGTITDATGLSVGAKGELDGLVIGELGKAYVQTIGAGGYNIQCFHFRTLVHEVK